MLGIPLEMVHGGLRVGAIYMAGVAGGKLSVLAGPYPEKRFGASELLLVNKFFYGHVVNL